MFTIEDIRNIAIQIEKNGEETYRNASKAAKDPEVAKMLAWMADEERHHAQWFSGLKSNRKLPPEQQEMEIMGRALLQDMIKGNNFLIDENELQNAKTVEEVVARSKTLELDTILFYEFLINFLDDQEAIVQLKRIIEEERNHIKQLERINNPKSCESCSCP